MLTTELEGAWTGNRLTLQGEDKAGIEVAGGNSGQRQNTI